MSWLDPPQAGTTWRCPRLYVGGKIHQRQETRRVKDRNLGGDVLYYTSLERYQYQRQCTEVEWDAWIKTSKAKEIES